MPRASRDRTAFFIVGFGLAVFAVAPAASAQVNVATQHNDVARTGANLEETTLTTLNVNSGQFGKLFERNVDDDIYAQPLYVSSVDVPGLGIRNVVYVATVKDTIYAFDADNPVVAAPIWSRSFINPSAGVVAVSNTDVGQSCGIYNDFSGNIGIVGTPVIDVATNTMYVVVRTKENGVFVQRLRAIDIRTGADVLSAVAIQGSVSGTGDGSVSGVISFNSRTEAQRSALLLNNGVVYVAWASHCDQGPYHGWLMGYDAATLQQVMVYNTSPSGGLAGIWQSGQGPSADASGNLYVVTGNGTFNGDSGGTSFGNTFLKISPAGSVLDWFTPFNWSLLNSTDADLGIQGAMLIPNTTLLVGGGKEGVMYLMERGNMGHFRSGNNGQIVQSFQASTAARMNGAPVYWNSPATGPTMYVWPAGDPLKAFRLVNGLFQTLPVSRSTASAPGGMPGGILSLSANAQLGGTGVLWAAVSNLGDANHSTQPGILRAYDASDVSRELWNSEQNSSRDRLGNFAKFVSPTIANGRVYAATFSNKLVVYGLLGTGPGNTAPSVSAGGDLSVRMPDSAALVATANDDGNPNPPGVLTIAWTKSAGPGAVTFSAPAALTTTASFTVPGLYTLRVTVYDGAVSAADEVLVDVSSEIDPGSGLFGEYFNDPASGAGFFTTRVLTRVDPNVNFDWGALSPGPGLQVDRYSVRWTGQVMAPVGGQFTFTTQSDDGVRLWVNGQQLINNWTDHGLASNSGSILLVAGMRYDIKMEYYDRGELATIRLLWAYPGQAQQPVPASLLFPAVVVGPPPTNLPPTVNAGADLTIPPGSVIALSGSASDDALPSPPGALSVQWSKISGREDSSGGAVVFSNPTSLVTTATFDLDGIYILRLAVNDGAFTVSDDITVTVTATAPPTGGGLLGQYFNDPGTTSHFVTPVLTRTDPTVDFGWGTASPGSGVTIDNFSVRWTGQVKPLVSGAHTFSTTADDGVRLWVNGQLVIDNWIDQSATTRNSAGIALTANAAYDIRLEYFEHAGDATIRLRWAYPGQASIAIPSARLSPASGPSNIAPTANAGPNLTVTLPATANLVGTSTDDSLPNPPGTTTKLWTKVSGPGTVTFGNAAALTTTAAFSVSGAYVLRLTVSDSVLSASDDVNVTVNPVPPPTGTGLTGQYFNDAGTGSFFSTLVLTRLDGTVNFSWGSGSPATGVNSNNFSARWTGQVLAPASGQYVFRTSSNDGVRLWVNGQLVINNWVNRSNTSTVSSAGVTLVAGTKYAIVLEYYDRTGSAVCQLQWSYPGRSNQAIPKAQLFP